MKKYFLIIVSVITGITSYSQPPGNRLPEVDKSPMDMSYHPNDYPVLKIQNKVSEPVIARVIYSRPQKNDRRIFGELIEFGKVWRLGANEATEIEFYRDVRIANKKVPKGRYTLYGIVNADSWTIIINKDTDTWGAFKYDEKKDLLRTNVPVQKIIEPAEALAMSFEPILSASGKATKNFSLTIAWDDVKVSLPIFL